MPAVKSATHKSRGARIGERPRKETPLEQTPTLSYLYRGNEATHVLLELDEYERLVRAATARELDAILADPNETYIEAGQAFLQIAGSWIEKARHEKGWTQQQLAERVGIPQSQISRIERNPDRTTVRTMKKIAAALGIDVSTMTDFGGEATAPSRRPARHR